MILAIDIEKAFDKIQHWFLIKQQQQQQTLSKQELEENFLNLTKDV